MSGTLTAERDRTGVTVTFTMEYADPEDHIFVVQRFDGTTTNEDGEQVEVWTPLRGGTAKFVDGNTDYERSFSSEWEDGEGFVAIPLQFPRTYRAQAFRHADSSKSGVRILHGQDGYTASVTVR